MHKISLIFPAIILMLAPPAEMAGQAIDNYQNPPGLQWKSIETSHYEIVFPEVLSGEGLRVANTLESLYCTQNKTLSAKRRRYSVFLTNQGAYANGYVQLMPRKSEWFHQPLQGTMTGSGEWYNLLAVHEGRHMVQFDKMNTGFTRFAGWIMGESGTFGFMMFSVPLWWVEGDAVGMETAMTRSGRGRIPEFSMGMRTQLLNNIRFSYSKEYFGSYRDWTPDWYALGYPLVSHVKQKYGPQTWSRIIKRTSRWSFWPFSFANAVKKETGKSTSQLYEETLDELDKAWRNRLPAHQFTRVKKLNREPMVWTHYRFPHYMNDSTVVVQKYGCDTPWSLVAIGRNGDEKLLKQIWPLEPGATKGSAAAGKIAWDEAVPDIRWGVRSFPSIVIMDMRARSVRRIAPGCRYINPSISPDGSRIAAVEFKTDRTCSLVILDTETGELIKRIPSPGNAYLQAPSWSRDGGDVVFTFQDTRGKGISVLDVRTGGLREFLKPGWTGISYPVLYSRWILFSSPKSGIDNIHAVDMDTGIEYQVTSVPYGAFSPQVSPNGKKLIFANYSIDGTGICEADFNPSLWTVPDSASADATGYEKTLAEQEVGPMPDESATPKTVYPIREYKSLLHLLCVHSWSPVSDDQGYGLLFQSTDKLNTLSLTFGPMIDSDEDKVRFEAGMTYAGLFPVIDFSTVRGNREIKFKEHALPGRTESWTETSTRLGLGVPMDLSRGVYITRLEVGIDLFHIRISDSDPDNSFLSNGYIIPVHYRLGFSRIRDSALRDAAPRSGQTFDIHVWHASLRSGMRGSQVSSQAVMFFPGLMRHHSLVCKAAFEEQKSGDYLFPGSIQFARGYDAVFNKRFGCVSASYVFPLMYPDFSLGSILYLKRIRGKVLFDYAAGSDINDKFLYRSIGAEMGFETHFFNLPFPLNPGVRWVHRIEDNHNRFEAVFDFEVF